MPESLAGRNDRPYHAAVATALLGQAICDDPKRAGRPFVVIEGCQAARVPPATGILQ